MADAAAIARDTCSEPVDSTICRRSKNSYRHGGDVVLILREKPFDRRV